MEALLPKVANSYGYKGLGNLGPNAPAATQQLLEFNSIQFKADDVLPSVTRTTMHTEGTTAKQPA